MEAGLKKKTTASNIIMSSELLKYNMKLLLAVHMEVLYFIRQLDLENQYSKNNYRILFPEAYGVVSLVLQQYPWICRA
jgi:hypothetical protein